MRSVPISETGLQLAHGQPVATIRASWRTAFVPRTAHEQVRVATSPWDDDLHAFHLQGAATVQDAVRAVVALRRSRGDGASPFSTPETLVFRNERGERFAVDTTPYGGDRRHGPWAGVRELRIDAERRSGVLFDQAVTMSARAEHDQLEAAIGDSRVVVFAQPGAFEHAQPLRV